MVCIAAMVCGTALLLASPIHATVVAANAIHAGPGTVLGGREWSVGGAPLRETQWAATAAGSVLVLGGLVLGAWVVTRPKGGSSAR